MEVYVLPLHCQLILRNQVYNRFHRLPLPASCLLCDSHDLEPGSGFCQNCHHDLPWMQSACRHCGKPGPVGALGTTPYLCRRCQKKRPPITLCITAFHYQYPINKLIQLMKYRSRLDIVTCMGDQLAHVIAQRLAHIPRAGPADGNVWPQALIPVPLHYRKLMHRGYNQSIELAKVLSRRLEVPLLRHSSQRVRPTVSQTRLDLRLRHQNVRRAFRATGHRQLDHVAMVDDVMTSGMTLYELGNTLRQSGIRRIDAWVLARASDHGQTSS